MEHFEIEEGMEPDEQEKVHKALAVLRAAALSVADAYGVCAICLIYALADSAADAEEKGLVRHSGETEH